MTDSPYTYSFDVDDDSTAACVVRNVGHDKYVLELGCAYGVMTKALVEDNNCRVFGLEYDKKSAEHAKAYCEDLAILDIENANWEQVFGDKRFDVIVAADVLEHLRNPEKCLTSLSKYLLPDGYIVISIPNVAYSGIVAELLSNDFRYRGTGLLDSTHLRFWGLHGIKRFLEQSGYVVAGVERTKIEPDLSEFTDVWTLLPSWMKTILSANPEGNTYQFVIKAIPSGGLVQGEIISPLIKPEIPTSLDKILSKEIELGVERQLAQQEAIAEKKVAELTERINQINKSISWRITRPWRFLGRLYRYGLRNDDRQRISCALRTRYKRLPLPDIIKRIIRFIYYKVPGALRRLGFFQIRFQLPAYKPLAQRPELPDYIVFGVIDWHFRHQRPQQLANALVKTGRRVFYISPGQIDARKPGFLAEALDSSGLLFQINLFSKGAPAIYYNTPSPRIRKQLHASLTKVLQWADTNKAVMLVQHPYWHSIASLLPDASVIYDCMDHHEGFSNTAAPLLELEKKLLQEADLTVVTSGWLDQMVSKYGRQSVLIRNAADYEHFSVVPEYIYHDAKDRKVIGYFGAIADWFDVELIEKVAKHFPDCSILLVGEDTVEAQSRLEKLANVTFIGEVPYAKLPYYLFGFDVCLLPFKIIPLTMATNPVKAYECLSAGKPVVSVDLPEMSQFNELVYVASDHDNFIELIDGVLSEVEPIGLVRKRQKFAANQTWDHRVSNLIKKVEGNAEEAAVSIVVVTFNNLEFTKACLYSIDRHSLYENKEIIVVDNASSDDTQEYLREWQSAGANRKILLNEKNLGFAAANNQGLELATGGYLVLLNNDTYVTPGWLSVLIGHLKKDKTIGLIGPVTNNIGNEARIEIRYDDMSEMIVKSTAYTRSHIDQVYPLRTAAFFCVMMERKTFEKVGLLDEEFGRGFFEDDDYCRRVEQLGLRIVCADDVFVHHHLSASFDKLNDTVRQDLFDKNKALYETKWGEWLPHTHGR